MCGIAGICGGSVDEGVISQMVASLRHRGPDSWGLARGAEDCVFGHARLSIMDLSVRGTQPMFSHDNQVMAVVNGEIYNYLDLKNVLEKQGVQFFSNSDSEVIANGYREWGAAELLRKLEGIFALGIYDKASKKMILARDITGTKPLYYHLQPGRIAFASELKALRCAADKPLTFAPESIWTYLAYRYLPAPQTPYVDLYKLKPGHFLEFANGSPTIHQYWKPEIDLVDYREEEAAALLLDSLDNAVRSQLMSDAPVGILLSGGIDSSAIAAIAAKYSRNLNAFCCGFAEEAFDERRFARLSAQKANIRLHETVMDWEQLFSYLPTYMDWFDEPFFNYSAVAIHKLSQMAKNMGIKVLLAGEGADEMFAGYSWYDDFSRLSQLRNQAQLESFFAYKGFFTTGMLETLAGRKVDFNHLELLQRYDRPDLPLVVRGQWLDFHTFLPDDVLCRDDRASMAAGIELRVPFLDNSLLQKCFLWNDRLTYHQGERKYVLKKALRNVVDPSILTSRKKGFGFPLDLWDRPMRHFANSILPGGQLIMQGFASPKGLAEVLGTCNAHLLWLLITAELWLRRFICGEDLAELCDRHRHEAFRS